MEFSSDRYRIPYTSCRQFVQKPMIDFQRRPFRGTRVCELGAIPDFLLALLETRNHLEINAFDSALADFRCSILEQTPACIETAHPDPSHAQTLNPKPSTLNPQPSTLNLNPEPRTLNPQPSTLNPQPSTLNPQPWQANPHGPSRRSRRRCWWGRAARASCTNARPSSPPTSRYIYMCICVCR